MHRFALLPLLAVAAFAQNPADLFNKPPADVDEALRARITEFFQYHVTAEYRKAEALVAEDTKDYFYTHNKPKYVKFEIRSIEYSDGFTKAKAIVAAEQYIRMPGFENTPVTVPTASTWKIENGKWMWYMDLEAGRITPFGVMKPGADAGQGGSPFVPKEVSLTDPSFIMNKVKADRNAVTLTGTEPEKVTITNAAPGQMSLSVAGKVAGVEAQLDKTALNNGDKAVLTLKAGAGAKAGTLNILVQPTNETIAIQIAVK